MRNLVLAIGLVLGLCSQAGAGDYCIFKDATGKITLSNQAQGLATVKCLKLEDTSLAVVEQQKAKEEEGHREIIAEMLDRNRTDAINNLANIMAQQQPQAPEWMPMFPLRNGNVVFQGGFQQPQQFRHVPVVVPHINLRK